MTDYCENCSGLERQLATAEDQCRYFESQANLEAEKVGELESSLQAMETKLQLAMNGRTLLITCPSDGASFDPASVDELRRLKRIAEDGYKVARDYTYEMETKLREAEQEIAGLYSAITVHEREVAKQLECSKEYATRAQQAEQAVAELSAVLRSHMIHETLCPFWQVYEASVCTCPWKAQPSLDTLDTKSSTE